MNDIELLKRLQVPSGKISAVLDTDAYNEIDDQYAIAYLLRSSDRIHCEAIYAAPFYIKKRVQSPEEGMEKSYAEIEKILRLCGRADMLPYTVRGSTQYLPDEKTPVDSPAARDLIARAGRHSAGDPLYVVAIGAITNIASAILLDAGIIDRIVVVWLGGHALHWCDTKEFNLYQDVAAARVVFGCGVPLVQLPCFGVTSEFSISAPELEKWLLGKNALCDYLVQNTLTYQDRYYAGTPWAKQIWDVTAVAWLLNDGEQFMKERIIRAPMPEYDGYYSYPQKIHFIKYIWHIDRNRLFADLFAKLTRDSYEGGGAPMG
jgi:hypothetical protein